MLITLLMFLPKASANPINDFGLKLKTWWANEKAETIYFQKGKREEARAQWSNTVIKFKSLFNNWINLHWLWHN